MAKIKKWVETSKKEPLKVYMGIPLNSEATSGISAGVIAHRQVFFNENHEVVVDTEHRRLQRIRKANHKKWLENRPTGKNIKSYNRAEDDKDVYI